MSTASPVVGDSLGRRRPWRPAGRSQHVDALRALAILIVVVSHAGLGAVVPGSTGVTIFFAISGFIITTVLLRERSRSGGFHVGRFYVNRIFKLFPPFLVVVIVPTLVYAVFARVDWGAFLAQIFFAYNWLYMNGAGHAVLPGSSVVWSLAIEEQFYIVFALFWLFAVKAKRYTGIVLLLSSIVIVGALAVRVALWAGGAPDDRILYGTDTRADSIALGVVAAVLYAHRASTRPLIRRALGVLRSNATVAVSLLLFALSAVFVHSSFYSDTLRFTMEPLAAALFLLYGMLRESGRLRGIIRRVADSSAVQLVGLASYSIYLVHLILIDALGPALSGLPALLRVLLLSAIGVGVGILLWIAIERPALALRKRIQRRHPLDPPTADASQGGPPGQAPSSR